MLRLLTVIFLLWLPVQSQAGECKAGEREEFPAFFARYASDKPFAVSRTVFPLKKLKWEFGTDAKGNDASAPVRSQVSKAEFAAAPTLSAYMQENGLTSKIKELSPKAAVVEIFKPDTDWLTTHHFRRQGNCWFLHEYQDHSL